MIRNNDAFDAHQRARFMRPDAGRWLRADAARWLKPPHPDKQKYSPSQPRDERGRWTDAGNDKGMENGDDSAFVQDVLAKVRKLSLMASPADWRRCVNLFYPILERFSSPGSDVRYWDYQKCLNACLGLNR
jgi:hypothetical protein